MTESEPAELECFHFLLTPLAYDSVAYDLASESQNVGVESRSGRINLQSQSTFPCFCGWFSSSTSACDSDNLVFT